MNEYHNTCPNTSSLDEENQMKSCHFLHEAFLKRLAKIVCPWPPLGC
jgi:hypothetical protein